MMGGGLKDPHIPMATQSSESITLLLERWTEGDASALDRLMPLVYDELHRLAVNYLRRERREHTLQPTALVNELYLKIFDQRTNWRNRAHFYGIAAQLMRRILVDHARAHYSTKRGGDRFCVSLRNVAAIFGSEPDADLLALHDVLNRLEELDPDQARIVELRFFAGLTIKETAEVMHSSHATVEREWRIAKAFLKSELTKTTHSL
jgi:RNA polymerase sigma factor (TIGR02999 family)